MYKFNIQLDIAKWIFDKWIIWQMEYDEPAPNVEEIIQEYIDYVMSLDKNDEENEILQDIVWIAIKTGREFNVKLVLE